MKEELYGLILAGGSGSRLWPMSREMYPKQLLKIGSKLTLFQSTFKRLVNNIDDKNIYSITNVKHSSNIKMQLSEMQKKFCRTTSYKVITEPVGRNTAPAIALAVQFIKKEAGKEKDPIILVVPSDQSIGDEADFANTVEKGIKLAKEGYIVTFGVVPRRIDTGFGYIKTGKNAKLQELVKTALKVSEFKEKPDKKTAEEYVKSGKYFWNAGIFMFKTSTFMNELKKYSPEITNILKSAQLSEKEPSINYDIFSKMPDISIDYALMEKSKKIALLSLDCDWNDLGSWEAIYDVSEKDKNGNYKLGNVIDVGSKNSMFYSTSKLVTTIGLENTVVIETEDALLVCDKSKTQDVKKIYEKLKDKNDPTHQIHKTVYRPWGYYTVLQQGEGFLTKCISVNAGAKLSLQKHFHRSEHWVVLEGKALVVKGEEKRELKTGDSINIGVEEIHSLQNPYDKQLKILEVQKGNKLDENDIVRLEDMYGRA
ncbi:mannose-1-phosphate guanylyltransferase/mannose-6-phosphate isomerase [bacterium]|nr:mannose-1-phosphate guanylyltransferase/mannose-6-phosphate isomerase [bacterium]